MRMLGRLVGRDVDDRRTRAVDLEPMRKRHLRAVLAIERQVYPQPWTPGVFHSELALAREDQRYYVVAKRGSTVVGYAGLLFSLEEAHVTNIAVDPRLQRQGIGRTLLADLAREARRRGCTALTLEVRVSNRAAQELYRRFGFVPAGIRHRYYEHTEDAIVMWAHDINSDEYGALLAGLDAEGT